MKNLSHNLSEALVKNNIISSDRENQCRYGLELMLSSFLEILFVIIVSVFVKNFLQTVLFFAGFIPLRIYAGGYHADTRLRCFLILLMIYAMFTAALYLLPYVVYQYIIYGAVLFNILVVVLMAPLSHDRKSMNDKERNAFRKIALSVCFFEAVLTITGSIFLKNNIYMLSFVFGQIAVTVSMVTADIKNKIHERRVAL